MTLPLQLGPQDGPTQRLCSLLSNTAQSPAVVVFAHPVSPSQQERHMGRLCVLLDNGCVDLLCFGHGELIASLHGGPSLPLLLRLIWGIGHLETWYLVLKAEMKPDHVSYVTLQRGTGALTCLRWQCP